MHTASSAAIAPPSQSESLRISLLPIVNSYGWTRDLPLFAIDSVLFNPGNPNSSQPQPSSALSAGSTLLQPMDRKGKGRAYPSDGANPTSDYLALDMSEKGGPGSGHPGGGGMMQQELALDRQDDYIQSRSTAIEGIESTIAELGQIFQQLAGMVQQQGEMVQRIDADVTDISS